MMNGQHYRTKCKKLCLIIVALIVFSGLGYVMTGVATAQHGLSQIPEGTELGYDDGEVDGYVSSGHRGHAVFFSNEGKLNIYGMKICGARYDDATREFEIEIWDNNLKTLYSASYDYTDYFPESYTPLEYSDLRWVTINIPNIEVNGNFYITVFTYSGLPSWDKGAHDPHARKGGIAIGCDSDTKSGNSFIVDKNPNSIVDWETITTWDIRQEDSDWMIRVVTAQGASTTSSADFTIEPSQNINLGDVVTFDPSLSTGDIMFYYWDFGDGETEPPTSIPEEIKHLYKSSGTFTVKLTVSTVDGNSKSITKTVNVGSKYVNAILEIHSDKDIGTTSYSYDAIYTKSALLNVRVEKYSNTEGLSGIEVGNSVKNDVVGFFTFERLIGKVSSEGITKLIEKAGYRINPLITYILLVKDVSEFVEYMQEYSYIDSGETDSNGEFILHIPYESARIRETVPIGDQSPNEDIDLKIDRKILEPDNLQFQETPEQLIYINKENTGLSKKTVNQQKFAYMKKIDPSALPEGITFYYEPRVQNKEKAKSSRPKLEITVNRQIKDEDIPLIGVSICIIVNDMCQSIGSTSSDGTLRLTEDELVHIDPHGTYTLVAGDGIFHSREKKQFTFNNDGTTHVDIALEKKELPTIPSYIAVFAKTPQEHPNIVTYPHANSIKNFIQNKGIYAEYIDPMNSEIRKNPTTMNEKMQAIISGSDWIIVLCSFEDIQKPFADFNPYFKFSADKKKPEDALKEGTGWKIIKYTSENIGPSGETSQYLYYIVTEDNTEILETAVKEFFEIMEQELGPSGTPVESSSGEGAVYFDTGTANIENIIAVNEDDIPEAPPRDVNLPYGLFRFDITDLSIGESVTITLTFPDSLSEGTTYWKYGKTQDKSVDHWYEIPVGDDDGDNIITITLTDGGLGDDDLTANGVIVDDGGPGTMEATSAQTPGFEAVFVIAGLLVVVYLVIRRKRK